jgi:hypothetical protein
MCGSLRPHVPQLSSGAADILKLVGDGGFSSYEFEIMQELGSISIQQVEGSSDDESQGFPGRARGRSSRPAVIAYAASYTSGMPFQVTCAEGGVVWGC